MRKLLLLLLLLPAIARAQISGAGQLGCSGTAVVGTVINSSTANNTVVSSLASFPAWGVFVQLDQTTTITAGAVTFNISFDGGANYIAVPIAQVLNPSNYQQLTNPYTLTASTNQGFLIPLNGATNFQIKLTTAMTGTGAITPYLTAICTTPLSLQYDANGNALVHVTGNAAVNLLQIGSSNVVADPCQQLARSTQNINLVAGGQLITGVASKQTYICSIDVITATAQNIALVEGTGTTCATGTAGMAGGATAATGWNFSANGGLVKGTGANWVFKTVTAADNVCLLLSSTGQTSGSVQYVQQ